MSVALLDVNLLVALFDPDHVHHDIAHDWFGDHRDHGWATCPVTENGFVRVLSNPAYGYESLRPDRLLQYLRAFCDSGHHVFWSDAISLREERLFNPAMMLSPRQVTDVYLLALATSMNGCLATLDRNIPLKAVVGATAATLLIVAPDADR